MNDSKYCYPNSNVLKNKLNIRNGKELFDAEKKLTLIRLQELQSNPIVGNFDFEHLKNIHYYIFQDIYEWAGKVRTVEIGKGNLFCTTACINSFAESVFSSFYSDCFFYKDNFEQFVNTFAQYYGDLNALHPFREGNGRTQREFGRLVCLKCGYAFDLSCTTHSAMLEASILSFNEGDNRLLREIFLQAIIPLEEYNRIKNKVQILTSDDLIIENNTSQYDYYDNEDEDLIKKYNEIYKSKFLTNGVKQNEEENGYDEK